MIKDTYSQHGSHSFNSALLQLFLENRLRRQLPKTAGSILYSMHWKTQVTPAGRQLCRLVASGHHIKDKECILLAPWPTPTARDGRTLEGGKDRPRRKGSPSLIHLVLTSFSVDTTKESAQLHPEFIRWLMGYPRHHLLMAPTEMP